MKRRKPIEVIGLSFLDMICCAFGGIVVLYAVAPRDEAVGSPFQNSFEISVELAHGETYEIGLAFEFNGRRIACWTEPCPAVVGTAVSWLRWPGQLRVLVSASNAQPLNLKVAAVSGDGLPAESCLSAMVRVDNDEVIVPLRRQAAFRTPVDPKGSDIPC